MSARAAEAPDGLVVAASVHRASRRHVRRGVPEPTPLCLACRPASRRCCRLPPCCTAAWRQMTTNSWLRQWLAWHLWACR